MADEKIGTTSYAARWMGGFADEKPFVSLQLAKAATDLAGNAMRLPEGEVHELFFTSPEQLMTFLVKALDAAQEMFPGFRVERVPVPGRRH